VAQWRAKPRTSMAILQMYARLNEAHPVGRVPFVSMETKANNNPNTYPLEGLSFQV
jgi:hypothetical protein